MIYPKFMNADVVNLYTALHSKGEDRLYKFILSDGIYRKSIGEENIDVMFLNWAEGFFSLNRISGKIDYFNIAVIVRRAAHRLCRAFLRMDKSNPIDPRFLRAV